MKYYLETNALRALGYTIGENNKILEQSYSSIFSLFELAKGIDKNKDSEQRIKILKYFENTNLQLIEFMPIEMIKKSFFNHYENGSEALTVKKTLKNISARKVFNNKEYNNIISNYEDHTKKFQELIINQYAKPSSKPQTIEIDLNSMLLDSTQEHKNYNIPLDAHPSRYIMENIKQDYAESIYKIVFNDNKTNSDKIIQNYNNHLDIFFFAMMTYELKRKCLRESASKNDWLDILHTIYLTSYDKIIVSDDKIFKSILPNINVISIEEYKQLM